MAIPLYVYYFGRRNLSAYDRSVLALRLKELFATKAKENLIVAGENTKPFQKSEKAIVKEAVNTAKELAKIAGVSHDSHCNEGISRFLY